MKNVDLRNAINLLKKFSNNKLKGNKFEKEYIKLWRKIRDKHVCFTDNIHDILDETWSEVDAFVSNRRLLHNIKRDKRSPGEHIDEKELRKRVKKILIKLKNVTK